MYYTVELEQTVRGRVRIDSKGRTKAEVMEDLEKELVNTQQIEDFPGLRMLPDEDDPLVYCDLLDREPVVRRGCVVVRPVGAAPPY